MSSLSFRGVDIGRVEPGDHLVEMLAEAENVTVTDRDERVTEDTGLDYETGERVPNSGDLIRRGLRKTIQLTTRLKVREWF